MGTPPQPTEESTTPSISVRRVDPGKLSLRELIGGMTAGQLYAFGGALVVIMTGLFCGGYQLGLRDAVSQPAVAPPAPAAQAQVELRDGTILATHYPTGELFAIDPATGDMKLVAARLGNPADIGIRSSGEVVVLDRDWGQLLGVDPKTGHQRYLGGGSFYPTKAHAMALDGSDIALVALEGAVSRVDLSTGERWQVAEHELLRRATGIVRAPSGRIIVTAIPDRVLAIDEASGSVSVVSEGKLLWHPHAVAVENQRAVLVGTSGRSAEGEPAGILRVDLETGAQQLLVSGPFETIGGIAFEADGSLLVGDNGRGAPGDGFIARVNPRTRQVHVLVSGETSGRRFLNGRSVAVVGMHGPS